MNYLRIQYGPAPSRAVGLDDRAAHRVLSECHELTRSSRLATRAREGAIIALVIVYFGSTRSPLSRICPCDCAKHGTPPKS